MKKKLGAKRIFHLFKLNFLESERNRRLRDIRKKTNIVEIDYIYTTSSSQNREKIKKKNNKPNGLIRARIFKFSNAQSPRILLLLLLSITENA